MCNKQELLKYHRILYKINRQLKSSKYTEFDKIEFSKKQFKRVLKPFLRLIKNIPQIKQEPIEADQTTTNNQSSNTATNNPNATVKKEVNISSYFEI